MKIGILNSGGDCPGLNAVIHGVVGAAAELGWEVVGFRDGFEGLLPPGDFMMLKPEDTVGILKMGGTILGTTNKGHFAAKIGEGEVSGVPKEIVNKMNACAGGAINNVDNQKRLSNAGINPRVLSDQAFINFVKSESSKWGEIIKKSGATLD